MEEDFRAEMTDFVARLKRSEDPSPQPKPKKSRPKTKGPGRGYNLKNREITPKFDYAAIAKFYYESGQTQVSVAEYFGCSTQTVRNALNTLEPNRKRNPGLRKRDVCEKEGHNDWKITSKGIRYCHPCRKKYQRDRLRRLRNGGSTTDSS